MLLHLRLFVHRRRHEELLLPEKQADRGQRKEIQVGAEPGLRGRQERREQLRPVVKHVGGRQIGAPADRRTEEGRLPQFDGGGQRPVKPHEDRDLDEDEEAAAHRVVVVLPPEFLRGLRPLLRLVLILLGDRLHLRLQHLHLLRRERLLAADRKHRPADEHGQQQDRDSVIADHGMERVEHGDHRAGHPAEPAVVDKVVHPGGLRTILCQQFGLLRTGEDLVAVGHRHARIDRQFL